MYGQLYQPQLQLNKGNTTYTEVLHLSIAIKMVLFNLTGDLFLCWASQGSPAALQHNVSVINYGFNHDLFVFCYSLTS